MAPRSLLSSWERDVVLREARAERETPIPVRTIRTFPRLPGDHSGNGRGDPSQSRRGSHGTPPPKPPKFGGVLPPPRRPRLRRAVLWTLFLLFVVVALGAGKLLSVGSAVLSEERSLLGQIADLVFRRGTLAGERENRVNVLLAAIGGEGHQGENLADTIILASLRPREKDVALLSIPRDLYVKIPDAEFYTRINSVHAYGEYQRRGTGLTLLRRKVSEITGQPVHYVARVDFKAFKRIVDEIGGIAVTVPTSFHDYWHKISFPAGTEHMNGERALAYVRARYVNGPEGGDFKRAERTQQVLLAIRKKALSAQTAVDIRALAGILDALRENVSTNFTLAELRRLAELAREIPEDRMHAAVLTTGQDGLLVGTTEILSGRPAAVLRPRAGIERFGEIQQFTADIFNQARVAAAQPAPSGEPSSQPGVTRPTPTPSTVELEQPTADIRNGTNVQGLAARVAKALEKEKFTISSVGNAAIRNRTQTIVVDRTEGKKPASLRRLLEVLGTSATVSFPEVEKEPGDVSFIVFLGTDASSKFAK